MRVGTRLRDHLAHPSMLLWAPLLSCVLLWPALGAGWQLDDHFQRYTLSGREAQDLAPEEAASRLQLFVFYDGSSERIARGMHSGELPWWTSENLKHANLRYSSVLTMLLDYALWPTQAWLMHLHSLLWLAALVGAVGLLYRKLFANAWIGGLALLLYALDDAHAIPAVYLANRSALIAGCFGTLSVLAHIASRDANPQRRGRLVFASTVLLALSLSAAEIGVSAVAYAGAYACTLDRGSVLARLRGVAPHLAVTLAWLGVRAWGGFGAAGSGVYVDPLRDPMGFGLLALERAVFLLMGQFTPIPADLGATADAERWLLVGGLTLCVLLALFARSLVRDPLSRFFALGSLLSLLPVAAVAPQNRLLVFIGIGAMGLIARWFELHLSEHSDVTARAPLRFGRMRRLGVYTVALGFGVSHLLLAPLLGFSFLQFQESVDDAMEVAIASVPEDPGLADQVLVLLNPPDHLYVATAIRAIKSMRDAPVPRRIRTLAGTESPMRVTRTDRNALEMELEAGLFTSAFGNYFRSTREPLEVGARIEVEGLSVHVLEVLEDGNPNRLRFVFDVPLEHPSLRWLRWSDGKYEAWTPPQVGESHRLEGSRSLYE